jgi:hypothetical protein
MSLLVGDFVLPNGLAFSPDEKSSLGYPARATKLKTGRAKDRCAWKRLSGKACD